MCASYRVYIAVTNPQARLEGETKMRDWDFSDLRDVIALVRCDNTRQSSSHKGQELQDIVKFHRDLRQRAEDRCLVDKAARLWLVR